MAAYFIAQSAASGQQLYKLGFDESVTKWTDPGFSLNPQDLTFFNNAVWFDGATPANGQQLYKLGNDGSVTKWTADPGFMGGGLEPFDKNVFNDALWFSGETPQWPTAVQVGKRWQRDEVDRHGDRLIPGPFDRFQQCIVVQWL